MKKKVVKKSTTKKSTTKKSPAKPKRKAQGESELVTFIARLGAITEQLAQTAERFAQMALPAAPRHVVHESAEVTQPHIDEHADDVEVGETWEK